MQREDFFDDPNYECKIIWVNQISRVIPKFNSAVFDSPTEEMKGHLKPLLLTLMIEGQEVNKVLVDGGAIVSRKRFGSTGGMKDEDPYSSFLARISAYVADRTANMAEEVEAVNILPKTMLKRFGKSLADLKPHNIMISDYAGKSSHPDGMILLDVQIGNFLVDHSKETKEVIYLTTKPWQLYFDGSKHELGAGIGILIVSPERFPTKLSFKTNKRYSNNETEYQALIMGLKMLVELGARNVLIRGDSQLVIKQLTQEYKCLNEKLIEFKTRVVQLLNIFDEVELQHIPRGSNVIANKLAQTASGKVKLQALNYVLLDNELYKRGFDGILFRCLGSHESYIAMAEIHEGICETHQAGKKMKWVLSRKGLYWPTMIKDCIEFAKSCEECQKHGPIQKVPATSTPYYAQVNGQVEAANKVVIGLIKKHVSNRPRSWHETLLQILWAYRNSPRDATQTTPYKLVYGHEAILPIDINLQSIHIQKQNELPIDDYWNLMYDELISLEEERLIVLQNIVQQKERVEKSYNKKVKTQQF
uniref:Uncharacterized protein Mb2253c family n=1 Tax=Cajanus cajan TaxID=3821 RepID=A0A151RDV3_CAJCA|nr:Uncharacterized protein Mb2253c family [Cajanus cajan]